MALCPLFFAAVCEEAGVPLEVASVLSAGGMASISRLKHDLKTRKVRVAVLRLLQKHSGGLPQASFPLNMSAQMRLPHQFAQKEEAQKDRRGIYQLLSRLARSQADFYETQSDFYRRFDEIDERQARMIEILDRYLPPN